MLEIALQSISAEPPISTPVLFTKLGAKKSPTVDVVGDLSTQPKRRNSVPV